MNAGNRLLRTETLGERAGNNIRPVIAGHCKEGIALRSIDL